MTEKMNSNIEYALKWLIETNIRNMDIKKISYGGINNGYDYKNKLYPYIYSEITGYAISLFLNIYKWTKMQEYLDYAKSAADYLIRIQSKSKNKNEYGAIPHSISKNTLEIERTYWTFDNAMILNGLIGIYEHINDERYYSSIIRIADWILRMQNQNGSFLAYYDAGSGYKKHQIIDFYGDCGCLHVKNILGLMKLFDISKNEKYKEAVLNVCNWAIKLQENDGLFWANEKRKHVFTHAHCYATEGFLLAYDKLKNEEYLKVTRLSGDGLIKLQNSDGSLYRMYKISKNKIKERFFPWKTVDATAQSVRIWLILFKLTNNELYFNASLKGVDFLKSMQELNTFDKNRYGGFYYQTSDCTINKRVSEIMFTWCAQFSISAYYSFLNINRNNSYNEMVNELF